MPFGPEEYFVFGDNSLTTDRKYYDNYYYRLESIDAQVQKKLENFKKNLKINFNNGHLWLEYAHFLDKECANPIKTVQAFEKAQELLPERDFRALIGSAYERAGNYDKGIALIIDSIRENPQSVERFCILGHVYMNNDKYEKAIEAYKEAIRLNPNYEETYYLLGEVSRRISRKKQVLKLSNIIEKP